MLGFVRKYFRTFVEIALWLNLILCVIAGGYLGGSFGKTCSYYSGCSDGHPFLGAIVGLAIGIIIDILIGGLIVTFVEIGENLEIIKNNLFGIKTPEAAAVQRGSFTDSRDGKTYKTVKIGSQTWMAENLSYNASGSVCYDNDENNCQKYGRLYDWNTAMKSCPSGWHLPSKSEWEVLNKAVGEMEKKMKANSGWNNNGNGTNEFGFSALPGGSGDSAGSFAGVGDNGFWWSASEYNSDVAYCRYMNCSYDNAHWSSDYKSYLFSVRCVQD